MYIATSGLCLSDNVLISPEIDAKWRHRVKVVSESRVLFIKDVKLAGYKPALDAKVVIWLIRIVVLSIISFLIAVAGPFGTYAAGGFGERFFYWLILIHVSVVLAVTLKFLVNGYLRHWAFLLKEAVIVLSMTALFTPFLQFWSTRAFPGDGSNVPGFWILASEVFVICAALCFITHNLSKLGSDALKSDTVHAVQPRLARRLPDTASGQIYRLSMNGHKVQVYTTEGMHELRMRFADAVDEVSELIGFCTHRSHWVTQDSIREVLMRNGRPVLLLQDGDQVPVSRKYQCDLENAGIL